MVTLIRNTQSNRDEERRIITGLVVSTKVVDAIRDNLYPDLFDLEVSKQVSKWILTYYNKYKVAPGIHIRDLFEVEKGSLRKELSEEIAQFLQFLSDEYISDGINEQFIIDRAKVYLKERNLRKTAQDVNALLDLGKIDEAERLYNQRKTTILKASYNWVKPFDDPYFINKVFDEQEDPLFRLGGKIGELIGDLRRGWLFVLMGPMKRGKTWGLQDVGLDAMMSKKKVVYISAEMKDIHLAPRFYQEIGVFGGEDQGDYIYPCFDCCHNQDNSCNKSIRTNTQACPGEFDPIRPTKYKPCTACRNLPEEKKDFLATTWHFVAQRPRLSLKNVRKEIQRFSQQFGRDRLRMISYPAFSASMADVDRDLDILEQEEGFIPDVIITDYAPIMAPTRNYNDPRHVIDDIFKEHKRMAQRRSALVVTGTQSLGWGRKALNKDMQDETDIGYNAYILAHLDILMSLDQTTEEKEKGIWRFGVLEHRWRRFNKRRQVMALQQLELGQPVIDSELIYWSGRTPDE